MLGCIPFWMLLNKVDAATSSVRQIIAIAWLAGFGSGPTGAIIKAILTNVTLPQTRGQAFALFNLFDDFGKGLGPFFVALLIDRLGGRLPAFNIGVLGWVICGAANMATFFTVVKDETRIQTILSRDLQETP